MTLHLLPESCTGALEDEQQHGMAISSASAVHERLGLSRSSTRPATRENLAFHCAPQLDVGCSAQETTNGGLGNVGTQEQLQWSG